MWDVLPTKQTKTNKQTDTENRGNKVEFVGHIWQKLPCSNNHVSQKLGMLLKATNYCNQVQTTPHNFTFDTVVIKAHQIQMET